MKKQLLRRTFSLCMALLTLWAAFITSGSDSLPAAASAIGSSGSAAMQILRWELGDFWGTDALSAAALVALRQSPLLLQHRTAVMALMQAASDLNEDIQPVTPPDDAAVSTPFVQISKDDLTFADNGRPSQTVIPTSAKGYTVANGVYIKNTSSRVLDAAALSTGSYPAQLGEEGPHVLILHSHGSEAYSMPPGEEYVASGTYRTRDTNSNVVRVGDEIAAVLSTYGISVLHDRTLHDAESYNDAYPNSLVSAEQYLEKYPTISYILDIHRDAISDANGNQYKLVTQTDPQVAQCCLVMGLAQDAWQDNLQLAVAVQKTLDTQFPTLMRPIAARGYRYNQHLHPGSLLVEVGAAGNSLDEAIIAARHFAKGFAETILAQ